MKKPATPSMTDMLLQSVAAPPVAAAPLAAAPPAAPAEGGERLVAFGQRITAIHKEQLSRLSFWSRRNERVLLERALQEFIARQDPALLRPIPPQE